MAQILSPEHVQFLMDNGLRRILRPDPDARHQIVITGAGAYRSHLIAVSCNCKRTKGDGRSLKSSSYEPIETRSCWQPGEAIARWRQHVAEAEAVSG